MKLVAGIAALALAAVVALFFQTQNLNDRLEALENAPQPIEASQPVPSTDKKAIDRMNAVSTCLAQLHAQVVGLRNGGPLPPDDGYCKKHFYGFGPRVGD